MSTELVPSKESLATESQSWAVKARGLQVIDRESCLNASHLLRSIKTLRGQVQAFFDPHIDAAMATKRKAEEARKALADERDRMEAPLVDAETVLKRSLLAYEAKEEADRLAEERRLQLQATALAEEQTLAAAAAMELEATATGDVEMLQEAHDILAQPIDSPVVVVQTSVPKMQGVVFKDRWEAHPTIDVRELATAVGAGLVPVTFLTVNMTALNQYARATHGAAKVPGVKFFNNRMIAARG